MSSNQSPDPIALMDRIAAAEAEVLSAVEGKYRGFDRIDADGWRHRIATLFDKVRDLVPELTDPEVEHQRWMQNKNYFRGFTGREAGLARDKSPFIEGHWTDHWLRGWDHADRVAKASPPQVPGMDW